MEIKLHEITVREVYDGYIHNEKDNSICGYGGKLNIRPKYQREYIYKDKQRDEVIRSVRKNFPLNVMYWCENEDKTYELLDGQQRTISVCDYVAGNYSIDGMYFHSLQDVEQEQILNYKLMIYICKGNNKEKLDWFGIINIAGEELTRQELLNAVLTGEWLESAKQYFSKNGCAAYKIGGDYVNGSPIRQELLEKALQWICDRDGIKEVREYMACHQHDHSAVELWNYYSSVIDWVKALFPKYRKEMKGIEWGLYYNRFNNKNFAPKKLEAEYLRLCDDDDVTSIKGIYEYLLDGNEKHLSLRAFTEKQKRRQYEKQKGLCVKCGKHFEFEEMAGDHIIPWSKGGHTTDDNLQMLCKQDNATKSDK